MAIPPGPLDGAFEPVFGDDVRALTADILTTDLQCTPLVRSQQQSTSACYKCRMPTCVASCAQPAYCRKLVRKLATDTHYKLRVKLSSFLGMSVGALFHVACVVVQTPSSRCCC